MRDHADKPLWLTLMFWILIPLGFLITIPFAILILMTSGGTKSVGDYSVEVFIRQKPSEVYTWLTDEEKKTLWVDGFVESVPTNTEGFYVGAKTVDVYEQNGKEYEVENRTTKIQQNVAYAFQQEGADYVINGEYTLENQNQNTKITYIGDIQYSNSFGVLFSPYLTYQTKKKLGEDFTTLKNLLEEN